MQGTSLRDLTELVYPYGPFGFSIIFLYSISRWAYKRYDEASKEDPPNPSKQSSTKSVYLMSFIAGLLLVAVSVAWWFVHHPLYVVRGEIRTLDHNSRVSSTELYFLDRPHAALSNLDTPVHDEQFVALSEHPFPKGHRFPIDFSKNEATHDQLEIECGPDDGGNIFTPGLKGGKNTLDRMSHASSPFDWMTPPVVYAQSMISQPAYKLKAPAITKSQPNGTSQSRQGNYLPDPSTVDTLQDPQSTVGAKILALRKLILTNPQTTTQYLNVNNHGAPFAATLLDLTRHSDPELAYDAAAIVHSPEFNNFVREGLNSRDLRARQDAQSVVEHMDPHLASQFAKPSDATANTKNRALVPTNFPDGDRYYIKIHWMPGDERQVTCLADFFSSSLDVAGSPEQEKTLMQNHSERLIYSAYPEWVVPATGRIENCGAKVDFVRPTQKPAR